MHRFDWAICGRKPAAHLRLQVTLRCSGPFLVAIVVGLSFGTLRWAGELDRADMLALHRVHPQHPAPELQILFWYFSVSFILRPGGGGYSTLVSRSRWR